VTAVAQSCGYINLSCFSRDFNSRFQISPSVLLRQSRRGQVASPADGADAAGVQARS
jgi:AraC-like DNA-binding protein